MAFSDQDPRDQHIAEEEEHESSPDNGAREGEGGYRGEFVYADRTSWCGKGTGTVQRQG